MPKIPKVPKTPSVKLDGAGGKLPSSPPTPKAPPPAQKIQVRPRVSPKPPGSNLPALREPTPTPKTVRPLPQEYPQLKAPPPPPGPKALPEGLPKQIDLPGPKPKMIPPKVDAPINLESTTKTYRDKLITPDDNPALKDPKSQGRLIRNPPPKPTVKAPAAPKMPAPKAPPVPPEAPMKPPVLPEGVAAAAEVGETAKVAETAATAAKIGRAARFGAGAARVGAGLVRGLGADLIVPMAIAGVGGQLLAKHTVDSEHRAAANQLKEKYGIYAQRPELKFSDAGAWIGTDVLLGKDRVIAASDPNQISFYDSEGNDLEKADPFKGPPKKKKEATK